MSTNTPAVVVGVDGSADSIAAVKWAERYAASTGANVRLVTTWQWPVTYGAPIMFDGYNPSVDAQVVADKARLDVSLPDDRVQVVVAQGQAGPVLVDQAQTAIALVVGSTGHGAVSKLLLGSVSSYCVHHAGCPVVVVR